MNNIVLLLILQLAEFNISLPAALQFWIVVKDCQTKKSRSGRRGEGTRGLMCATPDSHPYCPQLCPGLEHKTFQLKVLQVLPLHIAHTNALTWPSTIGIIGKFRHFFTKLWKMAIRIKSFGLWPIFRMSMHNERRRHNKWTFRYRITPNRIIYQRVTPKKPNRWIKTDGLSQDPFRIF